jgi:BirA family biotin operon repressor/biotin-[acetyl-CoA-carboxylase] ligase
MSPQNSLPLQIKQFASCGSTNQELLAAAETGASGGTVYVTEQQQAGRGRRGRQWVASPGTSLTLSLLWVFPPDLARLQGLSLLVGLALVRALETWTASSRQAHVTPGLKWPNDLLVRHVDGTDAKVGGILIESVMRRSADGEKELAVVIGIGLNCLSDTTIDDQVAGQRVGTLSACFTDPVTPAQFLPHLLQTLVPMLGVFETSGFESFADDWNAHNLWRGQPVEIREDDRVVLQGRCDGVDQSGALNIMTPAGLEPIVSGDVSLRRV